MSSITFKEAFFLKNRDNLTVNVKTNPDDAQLLFGRTSSNEDVKSVIKREFLLGQVPKLFLYGPYGVGKTHTLYNLKHYIDTNIDLKDKCLIYILEVEFRSKTAYQYLHERFMEKIGFEYVNKIVTQFINENAMDLDKAMYSVFEDENIIKAMRFLSVGGQNSIIPWKWLCGHQLKDADLSLIGLSRNLNQTYDLVKVLTGLGNLSMRYQKKRIIFLIDEAEALNNVSDPNALDSFHDAFRKLADNDNNSIGFILSLFATGSNDMPEVVTRPDIITRIGANNIKEIYPLTEMDDLKQFVLDFLNYFIDKDAAKTVIDAFPQPITKDSYPFTEEALDYYIEIALSSRTASLPRNIIKSIAEAAIHAFDRGSQVIEYCDVEETAQTIFVDR